MYTEEDIIKLVKDGLDVVKNTPVGNNKLIAINAVLELTDMYRSRVVREINEARSNGLIA